MILQGADLPPIIADARDKIAQDNHFAPSTMKIETWQRLSSPEQRINFAQWYSERLQVLSDPESRNAFSEQLKQEYIANVRQAMSAGWIDPKYDAVLEKRIARTDVLYFSPFGSVAREFGGVNQGKHNLVALPTLTGPEIVNHEFGHSFAGVDAKGLVKHFSKNMSKEQLKSQADNIAELYTIVNEGFNEHMTVALLNGAPEVISPSARAEAGIPEVRGESDLYKDYREVFAALITGKEGTLGVGDIQKLVGVMVDGKFEDFRAMLDEKWHGRDVLAETLDVIAGFNESKRQNPQDISLDQARLTRDILRNLNMPVAEAA